MDLHLMEDEIVKILHYKTQDQLESQLTITLEHAERQIGQKYLCAYKGCQMVRQSVAFEIVSQRW